MAPKREHYSKARRFYAENEFRAALQEVRLEIELLVKERCDEYGVGRMDEQGHEKSLERLIDDLSDVMGLTESQISDLHKCRIKGNKGAHITGTEPSQTDAEIAMELLTKVEKHLGEKDNSEWGYGGVPMKNPDYYESHGGTKGLWARCYTREDLESNSRYVELKKRATAGDISAMLDIAVGFLPNHINWGSEGLIDMPMYTFKAEKYDQKNAYDARYYYWIKKACKESLYNKRNGKPYPRRYMATAFLEASKFCLHTQQQACRYVAGVEWNNIAKQYSPCYKSQYDLVHSIYEEGAEMHVSWAIAFLDELLQMIDEAGTCEIVSPVHQEQSVMRIKFLLYCCTYYANETREEGEEEYHLAPHHKIKINNPNVVSKDLLEMYAQGDNVNQRSMAYTLESVEYVNRFTREMKRKKWGIQEGKVPKRVKKSAFYKSFMKLEPLHVDGEKIGEQCFRESIDTTVGILGLCFCLYLWGFRFQISVLRLLLGIAGVAITLALIIVLNRRGMLESQKTSLWTKFIFAFAVSLLSVFNIYGWILWKVVSIISLPYGRQYANCEAQYQQGRFGAELRGPFGKFCIGMVAFYLGGYVLTKRVDDAIMLMKADKKSNE